MLTLALLVVVLVCIVRYVLFVECCLSVVELVCCVLLSIVPRCVLFAAVSRYWCCVCCVRCHVWFDRVGCCVLLLMPSLLFVR